MLDREPFLRAIFAAPDDDLPRLVFADWLEEHGDPVWAELIRVQCEIRQHAMTGSATDRIQSLLVRQRELATARYPGAVSPSDPDPALLVSRGFPVDDTIREPAERFADPEALREHAVRVAPHWYGATVVRVTEGPVVTPEPLVTILTSPVTASVTELDLSGREIDAPAVDGLIDVERRPTINSAMVEHLAGMRECRRLTVLDLRNNDLGNDALRALAESPYFTRLKTLRLSDGNRFRARVWQQVLARFGEPVVD